jgi:hypothetical protein
MKISKIIKKMTDRALDKNPNRESKNYNLNLYEHFNEIMNKQIRYLQLSNDISIKWNDEFNKIIKNPPDKKDFFIKWDKNIELLFEKYPISPDFDQFIKRSIIINLVAIFEWYMKDLFILLIDDEKCPYGKLELGKFNLKDMFLMEKSNFSRGEIIAEFYDFHNCNVIKGIFTQLFDMEDIFNYIDNSHLIKYYFENKKEKEVTFREIIERVIEKRHRLIHHLYYFDNEELKLEELSDYIFYIWVFLSILRDEIIEHYGSERKNAPFYDWNLDV